MPTIQERLLDPNERFSPGELYQAFEALAEQYGFHRNPELPKKGAIAETTSLTIPHFEDVGVVIVRPRSVRDAMIDIPSLVDLILEENLTPSPNVSFHAFLVALMRIVVVSPPAFATRILESTDTDYLARPVQVEGKTETKNIFFEFYAEYERWMKHRTEEIKAKKSGQRVGVEAGNEFSS